MSPLCLLFVPLFSSKNRGGVTVTDITWDCGEQENSAKLLSIIFLFYAVEIRAFVKKMNSEYHFLLTIFRVCKPKIGSQSEVLYINNSFPPTAPSVVQIFDPEQWRHNIFYIWWTRTTTGHICFIEIQWAENETNRPDCRSDWFPLSALLAGFHFLLSSCSAELFITMLIENVQRCS